MEPDSYQRHANSRWNKIWLNSTMHTAFEKEQRWFLLPTPETMQDICTYYTKCYYDHKRKPDCFTKIWPHRSHPNYWEYTFYPIQQPSYKSWDPITRHRNPLLPDPPFDPNQENQIPSNADTATPTGSGSQTQPTTVTYHPPYSNFPTLKSHVHPSFVLVNASTKIFGIMDIDQSIVQELMYLFLKWNEPTREHPPGASVVRKDPRPRRKRPDDGEKGPSRKKRRIGTGAVEPSDQSTSARSGSSTSYPSDSGFGSGTSFGIYLPCPSTKPSSSSDPNPHTPLAVLGDSSLEGTAWATIRDWTKHSSQFEWLPANEDLNGVTVAQPPTKKTKGPIVSEIYCGWPKPEPENPRKPMSPAQMTRRYNAFMARNPRLTVFHRPSAMVTREWSSNEWAAFNARCELTASSGCKAKMKASKAASAASSKSK